ncbi:tRNA (cytosine-C5-)-methyltransferase KNAG_0G01510 [Huiozyma naganishii CBS 8797]|uniref:SAM-dependent MTase RsmB/NOP-type domain-containing protein n=1 Tax=Huiozyma naganishii (strain ATCC MYA-139 / BCRC 22969 / CBS 8797 / KCTC 17520 / NBRC 10181 / NCYC 3082 / Yp74L-3) TaxID=1071383 RepID=J7S7W2_HUIN7|nr:hypothetical protein KNAG_0G01510 [Kazachstania naganishii CBS 8797]CCK71209.1 hypothetical protein KNAG_0G01510 [Kazachstania naganishii CBS 8797]
MQCSYTHCNGSHIICSGTTIERMAKKKHYGKNTRSHMNWKDLVKENDKWEKYYKTELRLFSDEAEWLDFKRACQRDLPLTFRITGTRVHAQDILQIFKQKHLPSLTNITFEGEAVKPPIQLEWYPNHLAWQLDVSKRILRKSEQFAKTHKFLVMETAIGNISRQEAVSMIPPLLLRLESNHNVLDMCAAPGSKTAQLIEQLHKDTDEPTGIIVANDSDMRRSYLLVHQLKRLNSSNILVVNHDAQFFPNIRTNSLNNNITMKFDRILCDVPCSGDGTLRKNINIWNDWRFQNALGLHRLQNNILNRGLQLLRNGGRLVYSTCSMNPIENEAVIANALRNWAGEVSLVNFDDELPGLIRSRGISSWPVIDRNGEMRERGDPETLDSWFPPTADEQKTFNLEKCIRVYPHQQDTGAFFIAVFEKNAPLEHEFPERPEELTSKMAQLGLKTGSEGQTKKKIVLPLDANAEPFIFLEPSNKVLQDCWNYYGIDDQFDKSSCLVRNTTGEPTRVIYKALETIREIILLNKDRLNVIHTGVKLFVFQKMDVACPWRVSSESLQTLQHHVKPDRVITTNDKTLKFLLTESFPTLDYVKEQDLDTGFITKIDKLSPGCAFVKIPTDLSGREPLIFPVWVGVNSVNLLIPKETVEELAYRVFDIEPKLKENSGGR